ncbi:hypothetical protein BCF59_0171 [Mycoplasmopsis mustelae]|uniref:Uncharacterized protein n=1 Tax=Mycoplasmopsis mustelae TaxID=171289 RepID=A0A4V3FNX3_9BACT|nr:hypothetical protein [Mycoplasmopsis mustelae]TDV24220.1 hypothetical protein BCF59_0171 [Mycoplasmopsis mustelae]
MKKKIQFQGPPFRVKFRWFWVGKLPLERKYKPKIIEYLFMLFANIIILIIEIILLQIIINLKQNSPELFATKLVANLQNYWVRIMLAILVINFLIEIILSIHIFYILSKTEFNKWIAIICALSGLLFLTPICIVFSIVAYQKNEIAFE